MSENIILGIIAFIGLTIAIGKRSYDEEHTIK